jgi:hypothetical protein
MVPLLMLLYLAADPLALAPDGTFVAPANRCIRVFADRRAAVRVNGIAAGDTSAAEGSLDITGFLRIGIRNSLEVSGTTTPKLVSSPLVYLSRAESDGKTLRVSVTNTTEHTMQVELGRTHQFTVSPGTTVDKEFPAPPPPAQKTIRMRATSDGLDLVFEDEVPIVPGR